MHTTNYENAFITVADDSMADRGTAPPQKEDNPSVAYRTWRMIAAHPYEFTSDDVIFTIWADRQGIPEGARADARTEFFAKGRACLRASDLGKRYGWGIHHDRDGKVAVYGVDTDEYRAFATDGDVTVLKVMRSTRR